MMKTRFLSRSARGRVTLLELVFVTLFFALSSVVIVRLFIAANDMRNLSGATLRASAVAQDWADRLYACDDMEAYLAENGWEAQADGGYQLLLPDYTLACDAIKADSDASGVLQSCHITAVRAEETLLELPVTRFRAREGDAP